MLGRVTSTPSGTRGSRLVAIGTPLDRYSAWAATVCSQRYNTRSRRGDRAPGQLCPAEDYGLAEAAGWAWREVPGWRVSGIRERVSSSRGV